MSDAQFQTQLANVRTVEEAKSLLTVALAAGDRSALVGGDYPYDLDLAGLLFPMHHGGECRDRPQPGCPSLARLDEMFAEATWELCLAGLLRPGPRSPMDKTTIHSRGYCLTETGRRVLRHEDERSPENYYG